MNSSAQVVGQTKNANVILFRIKDRLNLVGIKVSHPVQNRLYRRQYSNLTYNPNIWSEYEMTLDLYESIRATCLHIVTNDTGGLVDKEMTLSIMLAMIYQKPIVLTYKPYFKADVPLAWRKIVESHLKEIQIKSLLKLDNPNLAKFAQSTCGITVEYNIKEADKTTIRRALRAHLSQLLKQR